MLTLEWLSCRGLALRCIALRLCVGTCLWFLLLLHESRLVFKMIIDQNKVLPLHLPPPVRIEHPVITPLICLALHLRWC